MTYDWQQITSAVLYTNITICIDGKLVSQSTQNNTSTIQLRFRNSGTWWRTTNGTCSFTGTFTDSGGCATYPDRINDGDVFFTITKTISHDANGDLSILVGGTINAYINGGNRSATLGQVWVSLPHINRYATITGSNNFNDEQNPYFTFSNPAGYRINARLEFQGQQTRRDNISNTGNYTFELTTAERNLLRQYCTGKTMSVNYVLATCYTGTTEAHTVSQARTLTIINSDPTFNATYQDSNNTTISITNNNQQIIQNNSTLQFNITNATAYKYATLSSVSITINGVTQSQPISSSTLAFNYGTINVASNIEASVVLTDSRGFTHTISVPITILSWSLPSAIITLNRKSNYYTATDINVDANYSSLDSKNTITIKYRKKKKTDSTWSSYSNLSDNVTTTFDADNLYEWDIQVQVQDKIGQTLYNLSLGIGIPIMFVDRTKRNVGIDCFPQVQNALEVKGTTQVNGEINIADSSGNNPLPIKETIQKGEIYSTTETKVGTWINGKPIYRKVINFGALPNTATKTVAHNISNLEWVINLYGIAYRSSDNAYICINNSTYNALASNLYTNATNIVVNTYADRSGFSQSYVVIEYTKSS